MTIETRPVEYRFEGKIYEGTLAIDGRKSGKRPVVMVSHAWAGRTDYEIEAARRLAAAGYAGFAIDLYGKGVVGASNEENQKLMTPLMQDRAGLQARLANALDVAKGLPEADAGNAAAMGYCFGGLCVLDLARTGADLKGVASFHGLFTPPGNTRGNRIKAKVVAYHGFDDPMVPPEQVTALGKELTEAGADWQIHAYGGVMHAFTNKAAKDPAFGTVYDARADRRSWASFMDFLGECFA
ncbi:MAG: dienelactone hydrolase family protein [Parvularculaceae bacterium]|nr:dienelactone hydrolase family protein [Parvularculaceae bacterium]